MPDRLPPDEPASLPKGRILVIDDEADIRESLETLLCLEGYTGAVDAKNSMKGKVQIVGLGDGSFTAKRQ